jgi:hypothetical protein
MQEDSPIWPPHEAFYIQSMLFNSVSAVRSILRLENIFGKLPDRPSIEDVKELPAKIILNELHNMTIQAGALSRYFWPVRTVYKRRGELLCKYFAMTEESPLFNRDLRNAIEHFDERIDKYFSEGAIGYFFPEYVGLKPEDDGVSGHFFRAFFVDTGEFRLLNEEFLMEPLANEILFVHSHLEKLEKEGGRFQAAERNS